MPIFSAAISSLIVSPFVTVIDLSIIKSQIHGEKFNISLTNHILNFSKNPNTFIKANLAMFGVYFSTYATANITEKYLQNDLSTLFCTSIVNISMINMKDAYYSRIYNKSIINYPVMCRTLFYLRDIITISSNFIFKKDFVKRLENYTTHNKAELLASFIVPSLAQVVSTPIHIYAVDKFINRECSIERRLKNIKLNYKDVLYGRILRTIPAFCIGGFINDILKE
jgi:hypothetical protein